MRVQFPWQSRPLVRIKIEVTHDEPVLLAAPLRPIVHGYDERLDISVRTYGLEEISAEKLRSTRQTQAKLAARGWARSRARDFYDLLHLAREPSGRIDWQSVSAILAAKCALRGVTIDAVADIFEPALLEAVRGGWERTLGPFVRELPDVETVLRTRAKITSSIFKRS